VIAARRIVRPATVRAAARAFMTTPFVFDCYEHRLRR
jgi:hypothetical protein